MIKVKASHEARYSAQEHGAEEQDRGVAGVDRCPRLLRDTRAKNEADRKSRAPTMTKTQNQTKTAPH